MCLFSSRGLKVDQWVRTDASAIRLPVRPRFMALAAIDPLITIAQVHYFIRGPGPRPSV